MDKTLTLCKSGQGASTVEAPPTLPAWRIISIEVNLGTVRAVNAEAAIKIAIETFHITHPRRQRRLVATRIEEQ